MKKRGPVPAISLNRGLRGRHRGHREHGKKRVLAKITLSCESNPEMHKSPFRVFRVLRVIRDSDKKSRGHNSVVPKVNLC